MMQVCQTFVHIYKILELTTEEIQERHMKFIAEISEHLATEPIQSEELNYEQKQWLYFGMSRPFPKPYRPHKPIEIPYKWQEKEQDQEDPKI